MDDVLCLFISPREPLPVAAWSPPIWNTPNFGTALMYDDVMFYLVDAFTSHFPEFPGIFYPAGIILLLVPM
jgi:hypothetical protein